MATKTTRTVAEAFGRVDPSEFGRRRLTQSERCAALALLPLDPPVVGLVRVGDPDQGGCRWELELGGGRRVVLGDDVRVVLDAREFDRAIAERTLTRLSPTARGMWDVISRALFEVAVVEGEGGGL